MKSNKGSKSSSPSQSDRASLPTSPNNGLTSVLSPAQQLEQKEEIIKETERQEKLKALALEKETIGKRLKVLEEKLKKIEERKAREKAQASEQQDSSERVSSLFDKQLVVSRKITNLQFPSLLSLLAKSKNLTGAASSIEDFLKRSLLNSGRNFISNGLFKTKQNPFGKEAQQQLEPYQASSKDRTIPLIENSSNEVDSPSPSDSPSSISPNNGPSLQLTFNDSSNVLPKTSGSAIVKRTSPSFSHTFVPIALNNNSTSSLSPPHSNSPEKQSKSESLEKKPPNNGFPFLEKAERENSNGSPLSDRSPSTSPNNGPVFPKKTIQSPSQQKLSSSDKEPSTIEILEEIRDNIISKNFLSNKTYAQTYIVNEFIEYIRKNPKKDHFYLSFELKSNTEKKTTVSDSVWIEIDRLKQISEELLTSISSKLGELKEELNLEEIVVRAAGEQLGPKDLKSFWKQENWMNIFKKSS